ncbi:MAG TPA: secondary thiamine-phosphate synthase enzyme YjbQ [Nitrososphaerales archaeon]|nr:secondary thiamine-phosphate synthase enzyme YjbQ [Nitrososphaerales archaeon]HUK75643.1 secondary thiamine-phosphate synthase enzyme YjbQ [Nitrososphaerales archaeon]
MGAGVATSTFEVATKREGEVVDVTAEVRKALEESRLGDGVLTVFVTGSTAGVTTIEFEPGLLKDFPEMMERVAPKGIDYAHHRKWHDHNGHSHVKASLLGPSLSIPFVSGELVLGEWQQVVLVEFDVRPRTRKVVVQVVGE